MQTVIPSVEDRQLCNDWNNKNAFESWYNKSEGSNNPLLLVSSRELGFFNPRLRLNSTSVMYRPMQLINREDR